jgi:hypothetical protein
LARVAHGMAHVAQDPLRLITSYDTLPQLHACEQ